MLLLPISSCTIVYTSHKKIVQRMSFMRKMNCWFKAFPCFLGLYFWKLCEIEPGWQHFCASSYFLLVRLSQLIKFHSDGAAILFLRLGFLSKIHISISSTLWLVESVAQTYFAVFSNFAWIDTLVLIDWYFSLEAFAKWKNIKHITHQSFDYALLSYRDFPVYVMN